MREMIRPWEIKVYDTRVIISGALDPATRLTSGSFEIILAQVSGEVPTLADTVNVAQIICDAVNA